MPNLIKLRNAVDAMVKVLVVDSDAVVVELTRGEQEATLHIVTTTRDLGKIIGKQGKTVRALRILVHAAAKNIDRAVLINVSSTGLDTAAPFIQN